MQGYLIDRVKGLHGKAVKLQADGTNGEADVLCAWGFGPYLVEVKQEGASPRPLQAFRAAEWGRVGVQVAWIDSERAVDRLLASGEGNPWPTS